MDSQATSRECPICGSSNYQPLHNQQFVLPEGHPLSKGYDVVACDKCGFVYADTSATQADYDEFYDRLSKYAHSSTSTGSAESEADLLRLQAVAKEINQILNNKSARILDLGCATGGLLKLLSEQGFDNLHGLDPSPSCAKQASRFGQVNVGSLSRIPPTLGTYDLVILSHVLEHVRDVSDSMASLYQLVSDDGLVYVEVPDATRYTEFYVSPFHYFDSEHINHFSPYFVARVLGQAGFRACKSGSKTIPLTLQVDYPACWVVGRKVGDEPKVWGHDEILASSILSYIEISKQASPSLDALHSIIESGCSIVIWGVGASTTRLLALPIFKNANIRAFVDNNPMTWGQAIFGCPVLSPAELCQYPDPIVITSKLYGDEIRSQINNDLGLANEIISIFPFREPDLL